MNSLAFQANPLLKLFIDTFTPKFKERVISIFKIGSLGNHGDFSSCSDVDVALILDSLKESDYKNVNELWNEIKSSNLKFADRLSVFWSSQDPVTFTQGKGRFPASDRFDLIKHGILLYGNDCREKLPEPSYQDLVIDSGKFIYENMLIEEKFKELTNHPEEIARKGARYFSKFVLFPVRLLYTLDNPSIMLGSNHEAVAHFNKNYKNKMPQAIDIIQRAYQARSDSPKNPVDIDPEMLRKILLELYLYCVTRYCEAITKLNLPEVTGHLQTLSDHLKQSIRITATQS